MNRIFITWSTAFKTNALMSKGHMMHSRNGAPRTSFILPTALFTVGLIGAGCGDELLQEPLRHAEQNLLTAPAALDLPWVGSCPTWDEGVLELYASDTEQYAVHRSGRDGFSVRLLNPACDAQEDCAPKVSGAPHAVVRTSPRGIQETDTYRAMATSTPRSCFTQCDLSPSRCYTTCKESSFVSTTIAQLRTTGQVVCLQSP